MTPVNAEEPLPDDFVKVVPEKEDYDDEEKIEFPSGRAALPTFSAAFAKDTPPSQMKFGGPRLGPRFTNPAIQPFEPQPEVSIPQQQTGTLPSHKTTYSRDMYVRETRTAPNMDGSTLYETSNYPSRSASIRSSGSYNNYKSSHSRDEKFSDRWMIE